MPIILESNVNHPFLPSRGSAAVIEPERASTQAIRPLNIAIVNLMAEKQRTELEICTPLGRSPLHINLTFVLPEKYYKDKVVNGDVSTHNDIEHLSNFYQSWRDLESTKFDGLIVTGFNGKTQNIVDDPVWRDLKNILDWSRTNVTSSLFLCAAAQGALDYFYDIKRERSEVKAHGVFPHEIVNNNTSLLDGFGDVSFLPVSRWNEIPEGAVTQCSHLEIGLRSSEKGLGLIVAPQRFVDGFFPREIYLLAHPEYQATSLKEEFERDVAKNANTPLPQNYFPENDPLQTPKNVWRSAAYLLFRNWLDRVYAATQPDLQKVPAPFMG